MKTIIPPEIFYPESDGKPMAESDLHRDWMFCIIGRLQRYYAGQRVYVSGNLLIYYVEGDPSRCFAPDTFVVKDCDPRRRKVFKIWEEKKVPNAIWEATSASTRREDLVTKMRLYAQLGVQEYFLYDPLGEWLDPPLLGFVLNGNGYIPLEPDAHGCIFSEQLGLTLLLEDGKLAMFETATGKRLLSDAEYADEMKHKLAEEAQARKALEEELARLKASQVRQTGDA